MNRTWPDAPRTPDLPNLPEAVAEPAAALGATAHLDHPDRGGAGRRLARGRRRSSTAGPTITISFKTAEGLEAGKTKIKYKDVDIGLVKTVALAEDRKSGRRHRGAAQGGRGFPRGGHALLDGAATHHRRAGSPGSGRCSRAPTSRWIPAGLEAEAARVRRPRRAADRDARGRPGGSSS